MNQTEKEEIKKHIKDILENVVAIKAIIDKGPNPSQDFTIKQQMLVDSPNTTPKASYE